MKFTRTVKCIQTYVEDNETYWSKGSFYNAIKHKDGNWSIETNFNSVGRVGPDYLLDDFEEYFVEV